ncbi:MAG: hypothetical protein J5755_05855, partial [Clostridia bacterium]|nr:hypothetical protein [Clostridia bacterium]
MTVEQIAQSFEELPTRTLIDVCRLMDKGVLADVLVLLEVDTQQAIIEGLNDKTLDEVMDEMTPAETADLIEDLPTDTALKIAEGEDIAELLRERKFATLKPLLSKMNEVDLARVLEEVYADESIILFRLLPKDLAAETFVELEPERQQELISLLTNMELKEVTDELFVDDYVD